MKFPRAAKKCIEGKLEGVSIRGHNWTVTNCGNLSDHCKRCECTPLLYCTKNQKATGEPVFTSVLFSIISSRKVVTAFRACSFFVPVFLRRSNHLAHLTHEEKKKAARRRCNSRWLRIQRPQVGAGSGALCCSVSRPLSFPFRHANCCCGSGRVWFSDGLTLCFDDGG